VLKCLYIKSLQILDSVYGLIHTACAHMTPRRQPKGYMRYTVKNLYNDFIILQDVFLTWKLCFFTLHFFTSYHNWPKFPAWSLIIQHRHETFISTHDVI